MALRVYESDAQGRWREGQLTWEHGQKKRKHQGEQTTETAEDAQQAETLSTYSAKGSLIMTASSLNRAI